MKKSYILALDQGTTGSRAIVYSENAKKLASGYVELPQIFPKPGWVSHDPEQILKTTLSATRKALASAKISGKDLAAIGITNQRETTILWDKKTSKAIAPAIVWQCRRTAEICESLKKQGKERLLQNRTGLRLDAYFSATKIKWLLENTKGAKEKAKNGRLAFGTVDSWLIWNLTAGASHLSDYTNASRTLLFNIKKKTWDKDLLKLFGISSAILPEVLNSSSCFGVSKKIGPIPAGIPIMGVAGDQQAALYAQSCTKSGDLKNTYGTGCFAVMQTGKKCVKSSNGLITTVACGANGSPTYALEGSIFMAGATIQWLRDSLQIIKNAGETEAIAKSIKSNSGVYLVPAFVGLGAPYWDQNARASISGLTRGSGKAEIVRAALESIAYQTADVVNAMQKDSAVKIKELKVDGGATANNFLMQFQADILGIPVLRPEDAEFTARGAALLAGQSLGLWRKNENPFLKQDKKPKVFKPKMSKAKRNELYAGWQEAINKSKAI